AMRGIAVGLRAAIDAGAAAARGFGEVLAFAAENAELLKAALLVIGGIKVFSALQASVSSWTDSWKKTQKEIIQTTLAEETRTAVANQARAAADRQKESLQSFIAELGRFRMELGMTNDEMQKLSFLRAKYDDLGAKLEGMPAPSNLDEQRELNDLTKEFYDIQEQITSFAMRQQEITSSGLSDEKERARILAEMAAARLEELNTVESIGLAIKGWIKTYGLTTALTAAISVATALIGKDISLWKNYIKQANAGLESFKHRITETQVDLENAMKAPDYDADKIGELTTKRMEEKVQALKSAYVDIRNAVANGEFRSGEMESLKSELFLAEAELKIRKKQNEEAEEKAKNEEKTAEAAKETAEALEAIEKASNITFIGDMEGEMRKYESAIRKAGKTMSAALKDARAEAQRLGVPFEDFERAIKEKGVKQIQELLDMAEKAAPELRELLEMKLGGLVLTDETGALKEAFSSLNIDKQLEQFKELREYMHIPEEAFLPQLKAMLANTTLTKDQWKKVSDMIKSATEAAKSFRNETAGKTKTALNQAQEWLKQGLISQKRFDRIAKENASAYLGGVADGLADVFSTLDLSETEMTTILLREMQGELEKAGIDAKALGKDYADLGKEMAKRMDFVSGDFGYTGKIKAGTGLDEIKKRTVAQVKLDKEAYETRMKYVKAVEASDAELARGGANAGGLPGGLEAGVQGVLQQAEQIREVLAAAFSGQAIANGMSLELQNVQSMITAMGDSLTLAATAASGHFRSMADDAGLIAERMRGALTENPLPMPDTSRDGVTPGLSGLQPQITSLQQVLTQETVTVRDLIQANTALEGRMKSLETALAKADFRTVRQEIDMDVSITSNTPAEAIREQIETNFSTV
ncbi:MAG: hypothetical protein LBL26_06205, partial [Peptococcaceae bacterium]|nr:hypothetical protein [Peptococcaceae bacterium]